MYMIYTVSLCTSSHGQALREHGVQVGVVPPHGARHALEARVQRGDGELQQLVHLGAGEQRGDLHDLPQDLAPGTRSQRSSKRELERALRSGCARGHKRLEDRTAPEVL